MKNILTIQPDGDGFRIRRRGPAGDLHISKARYATELEAIEAAHLRAVANPGTQVVVSDKALEEAAVAYQLEGYAIYHGYGRWCEPWNEWMRQGYEAALLDAQGIVVMGWPVAQEQVRV